MKLETFYMEMDGDYIAALERFRTPEKLQCFLKRLLENPYYEQLGRAVMAGDTEASFEAAHALKGVVANFYLNDLYGAICSLVEQLRPKTQVADVQLFEIVKEKYEKTMATIALLEAE